MIRIAIVEDDRDHALRLENTLKKYADAHKVPLQIHVFYNVISFLEQYAGDFEIVFMDIMMPMMNGMDASRMLREKDETVMLIFVTSMGQYAIKGYEVAASDFIVKPVDYPSFALKFTRALSKLPKQVDHDVLIRTETGFVKLPPDRITYIEVRAHYCVYHTKTGEYRQYQTMKSVEAALAGLGFARCNNYLLVNLAYVEKIDGLTVQVAGEALQISHPKRKAFTERFARYAGANKHD